MKKSLWLAVSLFLLVVSCCSTFELPTQEEVAKAGSITSKAELDSLQKGRTLMANSCAATFCHCLQPPRKHSIEKWEKVLPKMTKNAGLKDEEKRELEFYIYTVLKTLPKQK